MTLTGFLPKVRLCLCLLISILLGSCNLFHDTTQDSAERHNLSSATITLYAPGNDEGGMMNFMNLELAHCINYPEINWVSFHQPQVIVVQLWAHNRRELDRMVNQLTSEGIAIKGIRYNQ